MLLKFSRLEHVQNYFEVIHLEDKYRERQYCRLLLLDIQVDNMSVAIFQINRAIKRLEKNKSTAQKQEYLSVSDMTVQHEKKKEKMREYCKNIKEAELARYEEIERYKRINFMKSIASSVDHKRRNEKID